MLSAYEVLHLDRGRIVAFSTDEGDFEVTVRLESRLHRALQFLAGVAIWGFAPLLWGLAIFSACVVMRWRQ